MSDFELSELIQSVRYYENNLARARVDLRIAKNKLERKCHWCGYTDEQNEDNGFGPLIDFTLETSPGGEGYARVVRYACQEHHEWLHDEFDKLGFTIHVHGGICLLEASCVPDPYKNCPTPEKQFPEDDYV